MWKYWFEKAGMRDSEPALGASQAPTQNPLRQQGQEPENEGDAVKILKKGPAMRVIFFYPGEEGTYVDNSIVTLYENGIVHMRSANEETTTHLQNCEILWNFETEAEDRTSKVRLLKPKSESRTSEEMGVAPKVVDKSSEPKNPELSD